MQREIIIDGVSLTDLKARADALAREQASLRDSVKQGASKFIADAIKEALEAVRKMKEAESTDEVNEAAEVAATLLEDAKFVADVSGVSYSLPYSGTEYSYSEYDSDDIITSIIEDGEHENIEYEWKNADHPVTRLFNIAETMQDEVTEWNSSYC